MKKLELELDLVHITKKQRLLELIFFNKDQIGIVTRSCFLRPWVSPFFFLHHLPALSVYQLLEAEIHSPCESDSKYTEFCQSISIDFSGL